MFPRQKRTEKNNARYIDLLLTFVEKADDLETNGRNGDCGDHTGATEKNGVDSGDQQVIGDNGECKQVICFWI